MYAAYERATVACSILGQPAVNGITQVVGAPVTVLSGRTITPIQPLEPEQVAPLDSYRELGAGYIFATDSTDWATLQTVDEGMIVNLTTSGQQWIIRGVQRWERPFADFQQRHKYLLLTLERVKVTA